MEEKEVFYFSGIPTFDQKAWAKILKETEAKQTVDYTDENTVWLDAEFESFNNATLILKSSDS